MNKAQVSIITLVATVLLILLILSATLALAYAVYYLLALSDLRPSIDLPIELRLLGLVLVAKGLAVGSSVMRYRRPLDVLVSTSDTFAKLLWRKRAIGERMERTEPFIPKGPYAYVRNPMYFCVVVLAFGFGLIYSSTPLILWGLVVTCWFSLVQIPFEEKELNALFGDSYADYRRQVPMLFPYGKRYRARTN